MSHWDSEQTAFLCFISTQTFTPRSPKTAPDRDFKHSSQQKESDGGQKTESHFDECVSP